MCALVASRLCSPSPLYDIAGWASGAAVRERSGSRRRCSTTIGWGAGSSASRCTPRRARALAARAIERFGTDAGRLHVDLTTVRVAGAYEDSALVRKGWGSDRRVARQVRTLQAASGDGVSLYLRPDPGNCSELALVGDSLQRLLGFSKPGMLMVCDSARGKPKPLCQIDRAGLNFIVPLRADTGFAQRYLSELAPNDGRAIRTCGASADYAPSCAPSTAARSATGRQRIPRPASASASASPTSTPPKRPPRSPPPASARSPRPKSNSSVRTCAPGAADDTVEGVPQIIATNHGLIPSPLNLQRQADARLAAQHRRDRADGAHRRDLRARHQPPRPAHRRPAAAPLQGAGSVERHPRGLKQTLKVRPIFLHNDGRIYALLSTSGSRC